MLEWHGVSLGCYLQAIGHLLEAYVGTLRGKGRMLAKTFDQEMGAVEECVVNRCAAEVNAGDECRWIGLHRLRTSMHTKTSKPNPFLACTAAPRFEHRHYGFSY